MAANAKIKAPLTFVGGAFVENDYAFSLNSMWNIITGSFIFSMQCGFAFLEAGSVRRKNTHMVFYKIMIHSLVIVLSFWLFGYAFAFGDAYDGFIGGNRFYAGDQWDKPQANVQEPVQYSPWIVQYSIAAVVVAIANGSISERTSLWATSIHAFLTTLWAYPVVLSWTWGFGWLRQMGYVDFSGSGVVHCSGAYAGLAGLLMVGPRYNRWGKFENICDLAPPKDKEKAKEGNTVNTYMGLVTNQSGKSDEDDTKFEEKGLTQARINRLRQRVVEEDYESIGAPPNLVYAIFGGLFLWVGFIYYNGGASVGLLKNWEGTGPLQLWRAAELAVTNTFISGCSAGILTLMIKHPIMAGFHEPRKLRDEGGSVCNGFLAGMVACGAGMDDYEPWAAFVCGAVGALFYIGLCKLFDKLQLDDTCEAFPLHGGGGTSGVMCAAFLKRSNGILYGFTGNFFGVQLLGWVVISAWAFCWSLLIWGTLKAIGWLRTDPKTEIVGYDFIEFADDYDLPDYKLRYAQKPARRL
jgi:ammonia channel protein AmtB